MPPPTDSSREAARTRAVVDAVREVLGLAPLYASNAPTLEVVRFASRPTYSTRGGYNGSYRVKCGR